MPNYNSSHTGSEIDGAVTKVNASGVTQTELSYLDGLSSNIQTQLGLKAALNDNTQNIIANNITVHGTLTTKDSQNVNIGDAIITLNAEETGTPSENAGFEIERGTSTNTVLRWNESSDRWEFTNDGSTFYNIPISTEYNNYTLPTASSSTLGGIKVGTNLSIDGNGVLSASGSFTSFTIADSDSTQAIGDGVHIKFAASNSGSYGNSQISGSGTSVSPYLITLYAPDTDTNTTDLNTLSAGTINTANDSIGFIDADDSNASKKESIADFLTAIAGSGISASSGQLSRDSIALNQLSNVSSATPSTGQYLVYGGSQWEPTSVTAMTSWYLRDGDTTAVQVTNGKYVKFVEGNNLIDINFTDTDSGAVDDEFDITFTVNSSNITSVGTLTGLTVANNNITLQGTGETQLLINAASGNNAGIRFQENSSNKWTIGNDQSNDSLFFYDFGASATRFSINSSGVISYMDLYVNKASPYIQFGNGGNTTSAAVRIGGDNAAGGRLYLQYNGDSSYIDCYGGHGSSERYRDLAMSARSWTFKTGASTSLGTVLTMDSSQNSTFSGKLKIAGAGAAAVWHNISVNTGGFLGQYNNSSGIGVYCASNHNELFYYDYGAGAYDDGIVTFGSLDFKYNNSTSLLNLTSSVSIFGNTIRTSTNTDYAQLLGKEGGLEVRSSRSTDAGIAMSNSSGSFRFQLYGGSSGTEYGFLDGFWAGWDIKKVANGAIHLYGNGNNETRIGSADEWGRYETLNHTNGTYVYTNYGDFRVDGGNWNPYGNAQRDLGSNSLRWNNIWINSIAQVGQLKLNNNFKWEQGSSDYGRFSSWLQGGGGHGIYFPNATATSTPHWYPNNGYASYGTFRVTGHTNSYAGNIYGSHSNKPTVMFAESTSSGGIYYQSGRWAIYHNYGHNCLGVDTSSTESAYELKVNGDILATGDVVAFSDARWKTEIETISNPIDKIMDMRGVYYKELPKGDKKVSDRRKMGVIAQEMLKVAPEVVTYGETNDEYAVDYSKLVGILIEGIKELKQEINELKGN